MARVQSFGGRAATRPPPVAYLRLETSTTLRIKVAKANNTARKRHKSPNDIGLFSFESDGISAAKAIMAESDMLCQLGKPRQHHELFMPLRAADERLIVIAP